MQIVIDIPKEIYEMAKNRWINADYPYRKAIAHGVPLPTRSIILPEDDITNGKLIQALFPSVKWFVNEDNEVFTDCPWKDYPFDNQRFISFDLKWWESPYKKEVEENGKSL